jgi:hypothetical protein
MSGEDAEVFCTNQRRELGPVERMLLAQGIRCTLHRNEPLIGQFGRGMRVLRKHFLTVGAADAARAEILVDQFLRSDSFKKME